MVLVTKRQKKPEYKESEIGVKMRVNFSGYDIQLQMIQIYDFKQAKHNKNT